MKKIYGSRLIIAIVSFILAVLAVCGVFYGIKVMDIQLMPLIQRGLVDFSVIAGGLLLGLIILTFVFGRFYCSLICPFGIAQEIVSLIYGKFKKKNDYYKNSSIKYYILALSFGCLLGGSAVIIRYIDPYTIFSSAISLSIFGLVFTLFVFTLVFFKNRFFCSSICPVGALLGLVSKVSIFRIQQDKDKCVSCSLCAKSCPVGCIDYKSKEVDNERCIKCLKCVSVCKKDAIFYGIKKNSIAESKTEKKERFCLSRRNAIQFVSLACLLGAGYKLGLEFSKNIAKKIKNVILPPGSRNINEMANKCLNCNLCIKSCPNRILAKADKNCPVVHIDYSKGYKYCEYDCRECSKVCPSGAIKKITIEEKQKTRIAMAGINQENCRQCMRCVDACPKGAISVVNEKIAIDGSKCIGCGRCAMYCYYDALKIYPVKNQEII